MRRYFLLVLIVVLFIQKSYGTEEEYYWLDYNGTIPEDALIGGYDDDGDDIYVGLGKIENVGSLIAPLYPNKSYIEVITALSYSSGQIQRLNSSIQILCGEQQNVRWIRANYENLQVVLIGENPVAGGGYLANSAQHTYIGRVSYQNEIKIGPIRSYMMNSATLWFVYDEKLAESQIYEVLVYGPPRETRKKRRRGPHRKFH